jgi:hexosaminidase
MENQMEPTRIPHHLIPQPESIEMSVGMFNLTSSTMIVVEPNSPEVFAIGNFLARLIAPATGYGTQVVDKTELSQSGNIHLTTVEGDPALGGEGYELFVSKEFIKLQAYQPAGLFRGVGTLRQLLPASIEVGSVQPGPWEIPALVIRDKPRYHWRGAMLDVSRHFFSVEDVKRYIDLLAYYKLNIFHMHLTDDQGWRLMIQSWPNLAEYGGSTQVGGGQGGYYTQDEYAEIVAYAQRRYITIVPEIDLPGHTNAALASYPELNCDDRAPDLYTGTRVGFSSLCIHKEITYQFVDDVIRELAALTPGPYIHIGGDEAHSTSSEDYLEFMGRVQKIVQAHGKIAVGWDEIARSELLPSTIVQFWRPAEGRLAIEPGMKVIMSPASKVYLDMKYDPSTVLGLDWAGTVSLEEAYTWDPATQFADVSGLDVLGVEAPLWTETIESLDDIEFMAFPRLPGCAEIAWSPPEDRNWNEYRVRLAHHGPRLAAMGVNYYKSPLVPWP